MLAARGIGRYGERLLFLGRIASSSTRACLGAGGNSEHLRDAEAWTDSATCTSTRKASSAQGSVGRDDEEAASVPWSIVHRPILETLLKSYAHHPTVAQPLILHGPRGVGKRTVIQGLVGKWNKSPHISAYIDLYTGPGSIPPWTIHGRLRGREKNIGASLLDRKSEANDVASLGAVRFQLEQALEHLARNAIEMGYAESDHVLGALLERHAIDGALCQFLKGHGEELTTLEVASSKTTYKMWKEALRRMKDVANPATEPHLDAFQLSNNSSVPKKSQWPPNRKSPSVLKTKSTEESCTALAVAKELLKIQEDWRKPTGGHLRSQGVITRASADAATSWAVLLLQLLSSAVQEGHFQPKLVINNLDLLRKAAAESHGGSVDGAMYHDSLLMHITQMGVTGGCIPIIIVSSDSYYSCQVFEDHGDDLAFISQETFGWIPKEAAVHLVPALFEESEWKVITGILGPTARHLSELHSIWHHPSFLEILEETTESAMGDCIDLYLGYLQVTEVDPAMQAALEILEKFAEDCTSGKISKRVLRHGAAWRYPPHAPEMRSQWAKLQLLDYVKALADADFAVNFGDVKAQDFLEDPSTNALLQVGLLYQQREVPYIRPITRGVSRCLVRWHVRETLNLGTTEKLKYAWQRVIRGRFYKQLVVV